MRRQEGDENARMVFAAMAAAVFLLLTFGGSE